MAKRKSGPLILKEVELTAAGARGVAIGKADDGRVVLVKGGVPGDLMDVRVTRKKKRMWMGEPLEIHRSSSDRVRPQCKHTAICGGCTWQQMDYSRQLFWKQTEVRENLRRLGELEIEGEEEILAAPKVFHYRNKLEYSFSSERWLSEEEIASGLDIDDRSALGYHVPGRWDRVFHVDECLLQPEPSNEIRNFLHSYSKDKGFSFYHPRERTGWLRTVMFRNTLDGAFMLLLQVTEMREVELNEWVEEICRQFPQIKSIYVAVNNKVNDAIYDLDLHLLHGDEVLVEEMPAFDGGETLRFRIGPKSFYQTNPEQAAQLYRIALEFADVQSRSLVYDLYTGTGTLAIYMARIAGKVIGVEGVPEAVADADKNAKLNGISNAEFYSGDMRKVLTADFVNEHGMPDVVMTDPPREGMHPDVVERLRLMAPEKIVYVSCNSATQARDLKMLKDVYRVVRSRAVDMFPHTAHVENVVLLQKRESEELPSVQA